MKTSDKILNLLWNLFTSKDKTKLYLILVIILGFILRSIVASHLAPSADEAVYGTHAINFINSGAISNQNQSPVWFFLADLFYKIFGITLFTARLTSVIFGTITILILYLLAKELFNKKVALISAFLLSISAFASRYMVMEMDPTFTFLFFLSAYLFIKTLLNKDKISILSAIFLGIAILSKSISLMLAPSFLLIYLIYFIKNKEKRKILLGKENINRAIISIIIVLILLIPIFVYNYLLFKEKLLTDVMFARFFNVSKEFYTSISSTIQPFSFSVLFSSIHAPIQTIFNYDKIIIILSLIGFIILLIKRKFFQLLTLLSLLLPVYIFISGTSLLANHFVVFLPIIIIFSSIPIYSLYEKLNKKHLILFILLFITVFNIFIIKDSLTSKSAIGKLREFTIENIDEKTLVIVDARIYRGRIAWMFNDKHYLESSLLNDVFSSLNNVQEEKIPIKTYFIECIKDDCGWGTIKDQPDFNKSQEDIVAFFNNNSIKKIEILGGGGYDEIPNDSYFRIYETTIQEKPQILQAVDKTHNFFFYPVRYTPKEAVYDAYTPKSFIDKLLNLLAHLILYIAIFLALFSIPYTLYLTLTNLKNNTKPEHPK